MTIIAYSTQRNVILSDCKITDDSGRFEYATKTRVLDECTIALCGPVFSSAIIANAIQESGKIGNKRVHIPGLTSVVEGFAMSHDGVPYSICYEKEWLDLVEWRKGKVWCVGSGAEYLRAYEAANIGFGRSFLLATLTHPQCGGSIDIIDSDAKVSKTILLPEHLEAEDIIYSSEMEFGDRFSALSF